MLKLLSFPGVVAAASLLLCAQQQQPKLTAREMFFADRDEPAVHSAAKPKSTAKKSGTKTQSPAETKPAPADVSSEQASAPKDQTNRAAPSSASRDRAAEDEAGSSVSASIVPASQKVGTPLGLRYSILKVNGTQSAEVPPNASFHSGDHIQIRVETNDSGYLYIIHQGSSGMWNVMFPSPELLGGDNRVEKHHSYLLPPGGVMTFVGEPGQEKLFLLLARQPQPDLQGLIYSIRKTSGGSSEPKDTARSNAMLASAALPDSMVNRLRTAYSRDLITEQLDTTKADQKPDDAVYVVNPDGGADSHVVADLQLTHQ